MPKTNFYLRSASQLGSNLIGLPGLPSSGRFEHQRRKFIALWLVVVRVKLPCRNTKNTTSFEKRNNRCLPDFVQSKRFLVVQRKLQDSNFVHKNV